MKPNTNFYKVKKGGERLHWRFSPDENGQYKSFKPNKNDADALLSVLGYITRQQEKNIGGNELFIKLFIYVMTRTITEYNTDVLDDIPQKVVSQILDRPIENHYQDFHDNIVFVQINKLMDRVEKPNGDKFTKEELIAAFDIGFCKEQLNQMIDAAINRFTPSRYV